jgi:hypothetical protein
MRAEQRLDNCEGGPVTVAWSWITVAGRFDRSASRGRLKNRAIKKIDPLSIVLDPRRFRNPDQFSIRAVVRAFAHSAHVSYSPSIDRAFVSPRSQHSIRCASNRFYALLMSFNRRGY